DAGGGEGHPRVADEDHGGHRSFPDDRELPVVPRFSAARTRLHASRSDTVQLKPDTLFPMLAGTPPPLALARRPGFARLPSGASLGPQARAEWCRRKFLPTVSAGHATVFLTMSSAPSDTRVPHSTPVAS